MSTLATLTPDTALKALLDGNVSVQTSETESYILKVYGQNERPNTDLDDEFIEIYNNGVIQSLTKPYGLFQGDLALVMYIRANSDGTAKKNRTRQVLEQVETLVSCKSQDGYFFEFDTSNVITPTTTNQTTGYATTVLNIRWRTTLEINREPSTPVEPPKFTGHADAEGLRVIGWTDEDIAYYQENGVDWNEEDDDKHLVSEANKALYGIVNAMNVRNYVADLVYCPKFDLGETTDTSTMFHNCVKLKGIPLLDTGNVTSMSKMFFNCVALTTIPLLDTSNVTDMSYMFQNCVSLKTIPLLDTGNVINMNVMFGYCANLVSIPLLDTSNVTSMMAMFGKCSSLTTIPPLDMSSATDMSYMFQECCYLKSIPVLHTSNVTNMSGTFLYCVSLTNIPYLDMSNVVSTDSSFYWGLSLRSIYISNANTSFQIQQSHALDMDSLVHMIEHSRPDKNITITLASLTKIWAASSAEVQSALAAHPNVTLA